MLSRTSNDVDTPFDTASPPSGDLVTQLSQPGTLRPVSFVVEDGATQPSIRLKTAQEAQRGRRSGWRWPALVWSAVAITAVVARGPIAQSFGSMGAQGGSRPAAAGGGLDSAPSPGSVPATRAPRVFTRENVRSEPAPEKSAAPETKAPTPRPTATATATATATGDAKPKAKPKREKARPATGAAAGTPDEMAAAAATLAQAKSEETLR